MSRAGAGLAAAVAALAAFGYLAPDLDVPSFYLVLLGSMFFWVSQATSWNLLSGYAGYFSFGQAAFVGVGAYSTAVLTGRHNVNFFLTLPVAAALSALLALGIGVVAFRLSSLRGEIFALLTLAVPFILAAFARINRSIDGGLGTTLPASGYPDAFGTFQQFQYLLALVVAAVAVAAAFVVQHTRTGRALAGVHDAEDVAEVIGVPTFRYKMIAIAVSGVIGGVSGCVYALQIGFVTVESIFTLTIPLFVIVMSVLGGRSHWLGPVIGAVLVATLEDRLSSHGLEEWNAIIMGAILAVLVAAAPDGLYARLRAHPLPALVACVAVGGTLGVINVWGELLDWLLAGALAAVVAAIAFGIAGTARGRRARQAEPGAPAPVTADAAGPPAQRVPATAPAPPASPEPPAAGEPPAAPGAVLVECRDVARYFGGLRALDGVSLDIRAGELIGLIGPNGSGKTTLVNLLSGALRPSGGTISIDGHDITRLPPHRIAHVGIARTFQIPRPFDSMTVRDNVAMALMFGRTPMPLGRARPLADRHLATVALDHLADAHPRDLNLHQRQLLEMARAIASGPKLLLLDEALAGLNPAEVDNAVEVVRRIHASGITIVIVEHVLRVLNQLATRIVVLDRGTLLADGEPAEVMRDPAVVRAYLGRQAHV